MVIKDQAFYERCFQVQTLAPTIEALLRQETPETYAEIKQEARSLLRGYDRKRLTEDISVAIVGSTSILGGIASLMFYKNDLPPSVESHHQLIGLGFLGVASWVYISAHDIFQLKKKYLRMAYFGRQSQNPQ